MDSMLATFISESRDNLEAGSASFLALEQDPTNAAMLDTLFRSVHTMKGSSGLFDIMPFTKVVHEAESVLDRVRCGELVLTSEHIDTLLNSMDQVGIWLDELEYSQTLNRTADELSSRLCVSLRAIMGTQESDLTGNNPADTRDIVNVLNELTNAPNWVSELHHLARKALYKELLNSDRHINIITYTPDAQCFFNGEDPVRLVQECPGLITFRIQARNEWPQDKALLDPFHCNLIIQILTTEDNAGIHEHFRYVDEQIALYQLDRQFLASPEGKFKPTQAYQLFINDVNFSAMNLEWEKFSRQVSSMASIEANAPYQETICEWLVSLSHEHKPNIRIIKALLSAFNLGYFDLDDDSTNSLNVAQQSFQSLPDALLNLTFGDTEESPLDDIDSSTSHAQQGLTTEQHNACEQLLKTQMHILTLPCEAHILEGRIRSTGTVIKNVLDALKVTTTTLDTLIADALATRTLEPLATYLKGYLGQTEPTPRPVITQERSEAKPQLDSLPIQKTLRVDQTRIDNLMDLVGELVVAKNALPFLAKRAEETYGVKALAKEIHGQYSVINRLSEDLQEAMMQVRMVPLSTVFQRFPRLVRDLSRKLNKQISLQIEGEETEADKNVVEELADPLIHLVRNSLDHGLELPHERTAKNKPIQGLITLRAIPRDDQVLIEIIDDGKGIDPDIIKRKAYEKGVIDELRLDTISDQEALQLIFAPGFSTAEQISDISGRGVGMDVVRTAIHQAGGSVHVQSEIDKGTTIRLSLPLSMAVNRVMMIEVSHQSYGIGMQSIVETVKIPATDIYQIKQDEAVILRGRVIPIFHLRRLLGLAEWTDTPKELSILVVLQDGQEVGLVIDEFHEGIDTIQKPLEGVMANYPYYSGTALLGDGRVLLVLNTQEILSCR